jgi:hypothetical protein
MENELVLKLGKPHQETQSAISQRVLSAPEELTGKWARRLLTLALKLQKPYRGQKGAITFPMIFKLYQAQPLGLFSLKFGIK